MKNDSITKPLRILHLEDNRADADFVKFLLRKGSIDAELLLVDTKQEYFDALHQFKPDIILSDHSLPGFNSNGALKILQDLEMDIPFILITATVSEEFAVSIMKEGAWDYLLKDRLERLPSAISAAMEKSKAYKETKSYKYALDVSSIVVITDPKGTMITVNDNFCKITKYSREELIGQDHRLVNSGHHPKEFIKNLWKTIANGNIWHGEIKNKAKDNTYYWVDSMIIPFLNDGKPYQYLAISADVTKRKIVEQEKNKLQVTLEKSLNEIYIFDAETLLFSYCNQGALINLGYSEVELKALTPLDLKPDFTPTSFRQLIDPLFKNESDKIIFFTNHKRKNGSLYPVEVHLQLVAGGTHMQFLAVILDITERNKAQVALLESEKFNRGVLASLLSHIVVIDDQGKIIATNKSWENFSIQNGEPDLKKTGIGSNYFEVCTKAMETGETTGAEVLEGIQSVLSGKTIEFYLEYPCHSPIEERWFSLRITLFGETKNNLVLSHQNITERKLVEEKLRSVTDRLQLATKAANMGVWDWDINQNNLIWDDEMYNIYDLDHSEFYGAYEAWEATIHPEDLEQAKKDVENALHGYKDLDSIFRIVWKDKSIHFIKANGLVERDVDGKAVRVIGTNWDITKEKIAEENLELQNLELKKTNSELDKFVYSVSHDLRAPLTSMLGVINISLKKTNEHQTKAHLDMLKKSVNKLDGFIADILHYSRNARLEIKKDKINLKELLDDIWNDLKHIGDSNRQVEFKCTVDESVYINSDKTRLSILLNNLISNAIRYQNHQTPNPYVEISVNMTDSVTEIKIKDNGIGIKKEFHSQIFDMFYRVSDQSEGSGLGLYIAKESLDKLKGSIGMQSEFGKGTVFTITLPNN